MTRPRRYRLSNAPSSAPYPAVVNLRRLVAVIGLAAAALLLTAASAQPAQFRYWSYWIAQDGDWALPQMAPEERRLTDMDIDGWHFGVWGDDGGEAPRALANFTSLCPTLATAAPQTNVVRVAVVIDPGVGTDAPTGEQPGTVRTACLALSTKATSADALAAAARSVRKENNVLCGIDGYPRDECAPQIGGATASFTGSLPDDNASSSPTATAAANEAAQRSRWSALSPLVLGAVGSLLLLGGAALVFLQRPRR